VLTAKTRCALIPLPATSQASKGEQMPYFTFRQNNSGGSFDHEPESGIGIWVFVEAESLAHAMASAERIGLYFNGCESERDCPCCGDRWSEPWDDGTERPEIYGEEYRAVVEGETPYLYYNKPSYLHRADGSFAAVVAVQP
jgi:hypothetical protein